MALADRVVALLLALVAGTVLFDARTYPPSLAPGAPGPALFPRLLAGTLLALAALLLAGSLREAPTERRAPDPRGMGRPGLVLLLLAAFLVLVPSLDFFLLLPILLGTVMGVMGERRRTVLVGAPVAFAVFVYALFHKAFGIRFPTVFF